MKKILILFLAINFYSNAQFTQWDYNNNYMFDNLYYQNNLNDYQREVIIVTEPIYNYNYNLLYTYPNNSTTIIYRRTNRCNR